MCEWDGIRGGKVTGTVYERGTAVECSNSTTVVIPNLNGMRYLSACLDSLRKQSVQNFDTILIDNGSTDGSADFVEKNYPEVRVIRHEKNLGFCKAVNEGVALASTPYVFLLNNDTSCEPDVIRELEDAMSKYPDAFACASRMVRMDDPGVIDSAGDFYCALGWAFSRGKGRPSGSYETPGRIFSACAGAALCRRDLFIKLGMLDEAHFAYLEDVDLSWRARIEGRQNYYVPAAVVRHVGSASSGSIYNEFKIRHSSRNSLYLIYKNMPLLQLLLNLPLMVPGFLIKMIFFFSRGYGKEYLLGLGRGIHMCAAHSDRHVAFRLKNLPNYCRIQLELWINTVRRFTDR